MNWSLILGIIAQLPTIARIIASLFGYHEVSPALDAMTLGSTGVGTALLASAKPGLKK